MTQAFTNRLINESSPYLLQHAHNPVDWYPWGKEALDTAQSQNKIILVSIGYSACHWCHVMERESFEDEAVGAIMNEHFINIKIDREERPDLDHIYMDAVQAISGSGGWPLNVFLTPEAKPFYGGTYFPPTRLYNRPSWSEVLNNIHAAWVSKGDEITTQAKTLTEHLKRSNDFSHLNKGDEIATTFSREDCDIAFQNIMKSADKEWGGFGNAPKFPQTFTIQFLLQYHHYTGNAEAMQQALLSIDKMMQGGIYDHVGGGLARYSTDREWLAPHFEKMLYDNALLLNVLADAFKLTKDPDYEKAIRHIMDFVERELTHEQGGFYSALDADSEGEEGKYYVWMKTEIDNLLGDDSALFCEYFDISEKGNWIEPHQSDEGEGKNILRTLKKANFFAREKEIAVDAFKTKIAACLDILLRKRNQRKRPLLDDKILLNWNALMVTAMCKIASAIDAEKYRMLAQRTFDFLIQNFSGKDGLVFRHTYKNNEAKYPAFLDDYAYLIQASIHLQEITSDNSYLTTANGLCTYVLEHFSDEDTGFFFFTNADQKDVIIRKKEVYDGAVPSGNSVMAENLFYLGVIFDRFDWQKRAEKIVGSLREASKRYATSFGVSASVLMRQCFGVKEIAVTGRGYERIREELLQQFLPGMILQCSGFSANSFPMLEGKNYDSGALIYLCKNRACLPPVDTLEKLFLLMKIERSTPIK